MSPKNEQLELEAFHSIVSALSKLDKDSRIRVLQSVVTFLALDAIPRPEVARIEPSTPLEISGHRTVPTFSGKSDLSPKEFMLQKEPRTDIERIGCLAYYLTHYREMPQFKTLDISKLNTEAAQQKFSNPAQAVKNTTSKGLIVQAGKGYKQLSAEGEQFIEALPNREAAKNVLHRISSRRRRRSKSAKKASTKRA
jgi:hypothetical protein